MHADDQIGDGVSTELATLLRNAGDGRPMKIVPSVCHGCGWHVFDVLVDAVQGAAARECIACCTREFIADSWGYWASMDPEWVGCPCGGGAFEAAVAFSLDGDGAVRRVMVGLRCEADGAVAVHADWEIDYSPTDHLLDRA